MKLTCTMKQEFNIDPPYSETPRIEYLFTLQRQVTHLNFENGVSMIQVWTTDGSKFEQGKEYEIKVEVV